MKKCLVGLLCVFLILSGCSKASETTIEETVSEETVSEETVIEESSEESMVVEVSSEVVEEEKQEIELTRYSQKKASVFSYYAEGFDYALQKQYRKNELTLSGVHTGNKLNITTYLIEFISGYTYEISFDISSDILNKGHLVISDYENDVVSYWFDIQNESTHITYTFTNTGNYMINDVVYLDCFDENSNGDGTFVLDNFRIECKEDTRLVVAINQNGYLADEEKLAIFRYNCGDTFQIINESGNVVYQGNLVNKVEDADTLETNYVGDFTSLTTPGKYKIVTPINGESAWFTIGQNDYTELLNSSLNMLTIQRCGVDLSSNVAGAFAHAACHTAQAQVYGGDSTQDVTGGWHDAGDYGRYVITQVKTINDLLLAALVYPESFSDAMGSVDSGNGVSDVLDEASVGLNWLIKMSSDWNSVFNSAVTNGFPGFIDPTEDTGTVYLLPEENTANASSAGALALGAYLYQTINPELSDKYYQQALTYYNYSLNAEGSQDRSNPSDISAGDYADISDYDEIYFASCALYVLTHDDFYLEKAMNMLEKYSFSIGSLTYNDMGGYGTYLLLQDEQFKESSYYDALSERFISYASKLVEKQGADGYQVAVYSYCWGGNMYISNYGMSMLLAYKLTGVEDYKHAAYNQLCYLLGRNSIHTSYVSGFGTVYPENVHQRMAIKNNLLLKGALVGGADGTLDMDVAPAKKYVDDANMYTVNEVAIYYNSPFIFLVSAFVE